MMSRLRQITAAAVVAATATTAHADDVQLWVSAGATQRPAEQIELALEPQLRYGDNVSRLEMALVDAALRYRVAQWLRVGASYRPEYERNDDDDLELRHRVHAEARARAELEPVRVDYRLMLLEHIRPSASDRYQTGLRNLLEVSYRDWERWTPRLSGELFHALGDDGAARDWLRLTIGVGNEILTQQEIEAFYRVELPLAGNTGPTLHILGLRYYYGAG